MYLFLAPNGPGIPACFWPTPLDFYIAAPLDKWLIFWVSYPSNLLFSFLLGSYDPMSLVTPKSEWRPIYNKLQLKSPDEVKIFHVCTYFFIFTCLYIRLYIDVYMCINKKASAVRSRISSKLNIKIHCPVTTTTTGDILAKRILTNGCSFLFTSYQGSIVYDVITERFFFFKYVWYDISMYVYYLITTSKYLILCWTTGSVWSWVKPHTIYALCNLKLISSLSDGQRPIYTGIYYIYLYIYIYAPLDKWLMFWVS